MSIVFRCPECRHKLRASTSAVGKKSKCKCGALVKVPEPDNETEADNDEATRGAWRLQPKINADAGDLCEAITAWSPLCAPRSKAQVVHGSPAAYWQGIVVGSVGVLAVVLVVAGLFYAFRPHLPPTADPQVIVVSNPPAPPEGSAGGSGTNTTSNAAKKDNPGKDADRKPVGKEDFGADVPKEPMEVAPKKTDEPATKPVEPKAKPDEPQKVDEPPAKKNEPKAPLFESTKIEIVEWQTYTKVSIEGFRTWTIFDVQWALAEPLELEEEARKAGYIFVGVKVRVPARALEGKKFVVDGPDIALKVPSANMPFRAIGCAIDDALWFAPLEGQRAFSAPKDGMIVDTYLFFAPLDDLQSGRTTFQIKDQRAVLLTPNTRRAP